MLALRGLDYELDGDDALDDEWVEIDEWEPSDLPDVVERHEDEAATDPPQASAQADSGFGHAILAYRMLEYEQELAAFGDEDGAYDDDSMFGPADSEGASGTWQLSTGGGADAAAMAEYEALVGVVRGHLPVPEEIQGAVGLLQEEQLSDILLIDLEAASAAAQADGREAIPSIGSYMVIASGQSTRQINTAAYKLAAMLRAEGLTVLGTEISVEGERDDDWLVVDGGACVYSLFLPDARDEYDLEALWGAGRDSSGEPAAMWHIDDVDEDEQQDDGFEGDEDEMGDGLLFDGDDEGPATSRRP